MIGFIAITRNSKCMSTIRNGKAPSPEGPLTPHPTMDGLGNMSEKKELLSPVFEFVRFVGLIIYTQYALILDFAFSDHARAKSTYQYSRTRAYKLAVRCCAVTRAHVSGRNWCLAPQVAKGVFSGTGEKTVARISSSPGARNVFCSGKNHV